MDDMSIFGTFEILDGSTGNTKTLFLGQDRQLIIGRSPACDYIPSDLRVSNVHLRLVGAKTSLNEEDEEIYDEPPLIYAQNVSANGTRLLREPSTSLNGRSANLKLQEGDPAVLVNHGDILLLGNHVDIKYRAPLSKTQSYKSIGDWQRGERKMFARRYAISHRRLGSGHYGQIFVAWDCVKKTQLACKVTNISQVDLESVSNTEASVTENSSIGSSRAVPGLTRQDNPYESLLQKSLANIARKRKRGTAEPKAPISPIMREVEILKNLSHPNIIKLEQVFQSHHTLYIFQELVTCGDLFEYIHFHSGAEHGECCTGLGDAHSAFIALQIISAVAYLHDKGVVHRDLKPENILVTSLSQSCRIVITDFGCAYLMPEYATPGKLKRRRPKRMKSLLGTPGFAAPEMRNPTETTIDYTKAVDMWSIGISTAMLLTGYHIFEDFLPESSGTADKENAASQMTAVPSTPASSNEILEAEKNKQEEDFAKQKKILDENIPEIDEWNVSETAKDFVRSLLRFDEWERMTAKQALCHPWLKNPTYGGDLQLRYAECIKDWHAGPMGDALVQTLAAPNEKRPLEIPIHQDDEETIPAIVSKTMPFTRFSPSTLKENEFCNGIQRSQSLLTQ